MNVQPCQIDNDSEDEDIADWEALPDDVEGGGATLTIPAVAGVAVMEDGRSRSLARRSRKEGRGSGAVVETIVFSVGSVLRAVLGVAAFVVVVVVGSARSLISR